MRFRLLVLLLMIAVTGGIAWPWARRYLTLALDQFITLPVASVRVQNLEYDGGGFRIGGYWMTFGSLDNQPSDLHLESDGFNRVVMTTGGRSFILGPRTNPVDPSGRPEIDFVPERGDELVFIATRSIVSWPMPLFQLSIMGTNPRWKRYVYYRLIWKKAMGAELRMYWRYEQDYFAGRGWIEPEMMWNFQTGLLRVEIRP